MIIGQTLSSQSTSGTTYYSPWFPRGGNAAVFSCEVIASADTANDIDTFTIQVETKNQEDSDKDAVDVGSAATITLGTDENITSFERGASLSDGAAQGMKELVRFKYTVTARTSGRAWVHSRMLNPSWLSN
jgi:hypothetical protein